MSNRLPLDGIKVVELATIVAAPTCGRLLADFGADVVKIETPDSGDMLRAIGDMHWLPAEPGNNPMFDNFNTGKKLTAVNLNKPEGKEILFRLLEDADVFISNTRMRSLEKMGLGYDDLKERFPGLVYAHFSGFGLDGPDKDRPGYDTTAFWMRTGAVLDMVPAGDFPARPSFAFGDISTASYFLNGILIALLGRERTGKGTLVSTSLYNAGIWMNGSYVINTQPQYGHKLPEDRYEPWNPFCECYKCSDGKWLCVIAKMYPNDRPMLAEIFDMPQLVEDPDLATISSMKKSGKEPEIVRQVEKVMATRTSDEWIAIFDERDIPYEIIRHIDEIPGDEHAWANGFLETVDYPDGSKTVMPVPPIVMPEYGKRPFKLSGGIGQNTDEIMTSLGYSEEDISILKANGVIC